MPEPSQSETKLVRSRRASREAAIQGIYAMTISQIPPDEALRVVLDYESYAPEALEYIKTAIFGVATRRQMLDDKITPLLAPGWDWYRVAILDRAILRLAAYELFFMPKLSPKVTINEAVVLAKLYGSVESARFVNGLLAKLLLQSPKADWSAPEEEEPVAEDEPVVPSDDEELEELVAEGTPKYDEMVKAGAWTLRTNDSDNDDR